MPIFQQGMNQQTPAIQSLLRGLGPARSARARRKKPTGAAKSTGSKKRRTKSASGTNKAKRFVKGSAEAKRHMAKLRKLRKKK